MKNELPVTREQPRMIPVIICGGVGSRLWPVSRESMPKQFVELVDNKSTFQQTLDRVGDEDLFDRPIIITNADFRFIVAEQLRECELEADIVLEPTRRDSAMAIAVAAALAKKRKSNALVLILAADHVVRRPDAFICACKEAIKAARTGFIVAFGVNPTFPATNYGYIQPGPQLNGGDALAVQRFVEKPDAATARNYIAEKCLWNSGNFVFRADVMLDELAICEPDIAHAAVNAVDGIERDFDFFRLPSNVFGSAPAKSIDYAVMERTKRAAVVPVDLGWSDVGSWNAVWDVLDHDAEGNAAIGSVVFQNSRNNVVRSEDLMITAVVGLERIIVVATPDAVLVASRDSSEEVKTLVENLRAQNRHQATQHLRIYRPWGYYQSIDLGARYQVKRIVIKPGGTLSLQKHFHRAEHWVVVRGTAEAVINDKHKIIYENESIYVPIGCAHRLINPGKISLELVEVQVGSYLGEDDIVRLTDQYGRI